MYLYQHKLAAISLLITLSKLDKTNSENEAMNDVFVMISKQTLIKCSFYFLIITFVECISSLSNQGLKCLWQVDSSFAHISNPPMHQEMAKLIRKLEIKL